MAALVMKLDFKKDWLLVCAVVPFVIVVGGVGLLAGWQQLKKGK